MNVPTTSAADEEKIATAEAIIAKAEAAAPEDPAFKTCMDKPPASIRYPVCDTKTGLWIQPEDAAKEAKKAAAEDAAAAAADAPATEAPAKEAPAKEDPTKDAPAKDAPAKDAPAKEAPATDAPAADEAKPVEEPAAAASDDSAIDNAVAIELAKAIETTGA